MPEPHNKDQAFASQLVKWFEELAAENGDELTEPEKDSIRAAAGNVINAIGECMAEDAPDA